MNWHAACSVLAKPDSQPGGSVMTISGAMQTAITGLNGQSTAISYISDNVANANTNGYKKVESRFQTIVTQSSAQANTHSPGGATNQPFFANTTQGRSEEHTSELQALITTSHALLCIN